MKYCRNCKVNVNDRLVNCPLCGSYLDEKVESEKSSEEVQSRITYPILTVESKNSKNFLRKNLLPFFLVAGAVCIAINWIIYSGTLWSGYVLVGLFGGYFAVMNSVYQKRRLYSILGLSGLISCICVLGIDVVKSLETQGNLSGVAVSIEYIIPGILVAIIIATDIFIIANKSKYKYYFVSLLLASILALLPQLFIWILRLNLIYWFTFSLFFFSLLNLLVMIIAYRKTFKQEMLRKFNL